MEQEEHLMALDKLQVEETLKNFSKSKADTGSSGVQIALLTKKIQILTEHFKKHKKDYHSKQGLLKMVSRRKKLLSYTKKRAPEVYQTILSKLSLRK